MHTRSFALSLLALLPVTALRAQVTQPAATNTDVPVRSVVLFSSGVGYFEHSGTVRGNGATELRFKTTQINDILKSLVLQDQDGGRVSTITYPSQDPLAKTLRSFQVDITSNPSLADLLNQLRGARVTLQSQAERVSGTILGVEMRQKGVVERGDPVQSPILNLLTGATIRSLDLQAISSLSLDDAQLQQELTLALSALNQARDQDKKPVTINFTGNGSRRVRVGYVVEAPVWKASYRLLLDDKGGRVQGWAIVENQTESDWSGVSLSLVSGRPISFAMDLYQPLYATRPVVVQEMFAGLRPQVYAAGIGSDRERVSLLFVPPGQQASRGYLTGTVRDLQDGHPLAQAIVQVLGSTLNAQSDTDGRYMITNVPPGTYSLRATRIGYSPATQSDVRVTAGAAATVDLTIPQQALILTGIVTTGTVDRSSGTRAPFSVAQVQAENLDAGSSVRSMAAASQMGELFQYTVANVTLPRQQSAMLPIITDSISVERVSIYNAGALQSNPLNGIRLKNTTSNHLLSGPVTVLDNNSYAGDARVDNVPPGQERLISYGVDLEMLVDNTKNRQTNELVTAVINKGMLVLSRRYMATQEYQADNKRTKDRTLVIEHPIRHGWKLVDTQKPVETTPTLYRFQGVAVAGKMTTLVVKEETVRSETIAMIDADIPRLVAYSRLGEIPVAVRSAIATAIQMKQAIEDSEAQIADKTAQVAGITTEQGRIRENMKTVGQTTQYYERLLTKLNEQESAIEKLQTERAALQTKLATQEKELEVYLSNLSI